METRGLKRKNEDEEEEKKNIKVSFACKYCLRDYVNRGSLQNHINNFHNGGIVLKNETFINQLNDIRTSSEFNRRYRLSDFAIHKAISFDKFKLRSLRFGNFKEKTYDLICKKEGQNLEEKMVSKMQEIIDGIVFGVWNEVAKAKQLGKKDIIDVSFSEETDVGKLKIEVQKHCDENPESGKYITQLILPETRIRVKILEIIGKKVCAGGKKTFVVSFIDFAPHLVITEKRYREMSTNDN